MMNKEQLWKVFSDKNPSFSKEEAMITMSGKNLKKFFDQTWEQSQKNADTRHALRDTVSKAMGGFPWGV